MFVSKNMWLKLKKEKVNILSFLFFTCFFALKVTPAYSQNLISGNVKDESGKLLSNSSITYSSLKSGTILGFALSDKEGNYKLNINNTNMDSISMRVSHVGYKEQVFFLKNQTIQKDFKLINTTELLPEVAVKTNMSAIFRRKDTINYVTDSFLSKSDRVLSDVIKKLPGIEMNGDQIMYQGKPLKKFYVEGFDLMGGRYGLINNNLPVEDVRKVQVIENDQPIKILDSLVPSDQASLNIVLKKFRTTGSGKIGLGGAPLLWDVAVTPMSFFKNFQMVNTYQTNTTGNTVSDQLKYLTSEINPANAAVEKYVTVRNAGKPPFDESRWLNNNIHMLNSNILFKTKKGLLWKTSATYVNDLRRNESFSRTTIITPEENILVTDAISNRYNVNDINAIFSFEKNEKDILLKNQLAIGKRWNNAFAFTNRNNETLINQNEKDETFFVSNILNVTTKWGKQLVGINSTVAYAEMPQTLIVSPGQFIEILSDSLPYAQALQQVFYKNFRTNNNIDFIKKLGAIVVNIQTGASFQTQLLQSSLQTDNGTPSQTTFGNNAEFLRPQVYFNPTFSFIKNRWQFSLFAPVNWQLFAANYNSIASDSTRISRVGLNPLLNIRYAISSKWELSANFRHNNDFGNQTQLYTGYILTAYNNLERSTTRRVSEGITQSVSVYLKYDDPLQSSFANVSVSYSQSRNNYLYRAAYDSLGLLYSEMLELDNDRNSLNANGSISKYFRSVKTIAKLSGSYGTRRTEQLINNSFVNLYSINYGGSAEITNTYLDWLSTEYRYSLTVSNSHYTDIKLNAATIQNHNLELNGFFLKNQTLTVSADYYLSNLYNKTEQLLMNLKYTFTLPKTKIDFSVICNNIFNTKYFITQYNTAYTLAYGELYLRPRQVLASVRFNFK